MHTILPEHASVGTPVRQRLWQPIQVQSTQLSLDVMIYGWETIKKDIIEDT
jgi:hypothetical protein